MTNPEIHLDPDPPQAGADCKITYTGSLPHVLDLTFEPPGTTQEITIPVGGLKVRVPSDAETMTVDDPTGGAPARDVPLA